MNYPYECPNCKHTFEVIKSVKDIDNVERCQKCDTISNRYIANTYFYGASDWDTKWNPGLGRYTQSSQHKKKLCKELNCEEVGNEPAESIHRHSNRLNEQIRQNNWDKE